MTILRAGDREFHNLPAGQVLTVVASAASAGLVRRYPADSGFAAIEVTPVAAGATVNVGPFTGTVRLGVECTTGLVDWSAGPSAPALAPSVSGDGPRARLSSVAVIGDSLTDSGTNLAVPRGVGTWGVMSGLSTLLSAGAWIADVRLDGRAPSAGGTLETDGAARLRWTYSGDAPGQWVDVSTGGFFEVPSATAQRGVYVKIVRGLHRTTPSADALTNAGIVNRTLGPLHCYSELLRDSLGPEVAVVTSGIPGDTVQGVAARWPQVLSPTSLVDAAVILVGTNNIPASASAAKAAADLLIAALRDIAACARRVYVGGIFPRADGAATTAVRNALATYSEILREFCARNSPTYRYWDAWPALVAGNATDGSLRAGAYHTDSLHLTPYGAWLAKNALMRQLSADWVIPDTQEGSRGYVPWDSTTRRGSLTPNPRFAGSGGTGSGSGGVSGTVPASTTITRSGGTQTLAISTTTSADGQDATVFTLAGSTTASDYHEITQVWTLPSGLAAGNVVAAELDLEILSADLLNRIEIVMIANGNLTSTYYGQGTRAWSGFGGSATHRARVRLDPITIVPGVTQFTMRLRLGTASGGSAVIALRRFEAIELS